MHLGVLIFLLIALCIVCASLCQHLRSHYQDTAPFLERSRATSPNENYWDREGRTAHPKCLRSYIVCSWVPVSETRNNGKSDTSARKCSKWDAPGGRAPVGCCRVSPSKRKPAERFFVPNCGTQNDNLRQGRERWPSTGWMLPSFAVKAKTRGEILRPKLRDSE
jgi:hypothetical protein